MEPFEPSPSTWTIRFKYHKTTVLLHIDPQATIASVKEELLDALRETCSDGAIEGTKIPDHWEEIELAVPIDATNVSAGWNNITTLMEHGIVQTNGPSAKGKGKEKESSRKTIRGVDAETLKSLDCKDNGVFAFRFYSQERSVVERKMIKPEDLDNEEQTALHRQSESDDPQKEWDVIIPKWEDQYGIENEGDVGARMEYKG